MLAASVIVNAIGDISKRMGTKLTLSGRPHKQVNGYDSLMSDKHRLNALNAEYRSAVAFLFPISRQQSEWTEGIFTLAGASLARIQRYVWDQYPTVREDIHDSYHERLVKVPANHRCVPFGELRRVYSDVGGAA